MDIKVIDCVSFKKKKINVESLLKNSCIVINRGESLDIMKSPTKKYKTIYSKHSIEKVYNMLKDVDISDIEDNKDYQNFISRLQKEKALILNNEDEEKFKNYLDNLKMLIFEDQFNDLAMGIKQFIFLRELDKL